MKGSNPEPTLEPNNNQLNRVSACVWRKSELARQTCSERLDSRILLEPHMLLLLIPAIKLAVMHAGDRTEAEG